MFQPSFSRVFLVPLYGTEKGKTDSLTPLLGEKSNVQKKVKPPSRMEGLPVDHRKGNYG